MQAQLLSTVPSRAMEIGDGHAANDAAYAVALGEARPVLILAPAPAQIATQGNEHPISNQSNDDYWLGGYAGI
jgi:hypothetical protein